ncbi:MAG: D-glycero-beta-D-manno-heptose-7-phosphate kinase [Candidatus Neomarinimicrobiota bacterium]
MDKQRFRYLVERFHDRSVLVIGDLMLDQYYWGEVERISPEAPVPIVRVDSVTTMPGGAANVAVNLAHLGCRTFLAGLVGADEQGRELIREIKADGVVDGGIIADESRPTTVKTRIMARGQQVLRTDREQLALVSDSISGQLLANIRTQMSTVEAIIIADYNKGLLFTELIESILAAAGERKIPVYVDPKYDNFFAFRQVRLFKPNTKEFLRVMAAAGAADNDFQSLGHELQNRLQAEMVLITRSEKGMTLFHGGTSRSIPTRARKVHDVSGAGDTVIAVFTLADLAGATPEEAAQIANLAAGRVCAEVGAVPITPAMLEEIYQAQFTDSEIK